MRNIKQWADSHETDEPVAEAIFYVASGDDAVAERIWSDPTREEYISVAERATKNGLIDGNQLRWGDESVATLSGEFSPQ